MKYEGLFGSFLIFLHIDIVNSECIAVVGTAGYEKVFQISCFHGPNPAGTPCKLLATIHYKGK